MKPTGKSILMRRTRAGVTLVELLISLAVTGLIGLCVWGMVAAMAQGTSFRKDALAAAVGVHLADARLSDALRNSSMVLAHGEGYIVLWRADLAGTGQPNLSELQRIEFDAQAGLLVSYRWPADTASELDVVYELDADFAAITSALRGDSRFAQSVWARRVTDWRMTLDHANARHAKLISYRLTVEHDGALESTFTSAALRNAEMEGE